MAIKKFKKQYFLFGGQITRTLENEGIKEAIKAATEDCGYELFVWDEK